LAANIAVVGITDAGASSLRAEARALVDAAALLCGGERHLAFFPGHQGERLVIKSDIDGLVARLASETRPVVVLASGDPLWFGIGAALSRRLGPERLRILPNLSTLQLACARLGIPWQDAVSLSAHGRPLEGILPSALVERTAVILTDPQNTPTAIAAALLGAGSDDARADVFEHLGGPNERHTSGRLSDLAGQTFADLNLLVVRRDRPPHPLALGLPEEAYAHRDGQITKAEVRTVSLAKLRLRTTDTVWDIGAGCGSIAIEAAALARAGRVFAVERDHEQLGYLRENVARFGAGSVCVVAGAAPAALAGLPDPDAVFIGGSGGTLAAVLDIAAQRLRAGGALVANLVALEHLAEMQPTLEARGWEVEVTQVAAARSARTGGITRLGALNPVFIVAGTKS
jgi:precorrin-6Y C5,15-methyltransferase (decarboxylating)